MSLIKLFIFSMISLSIVICPLAHAIYSDPDLSKASRQFEAFTIDFRGIDTPNSTYWSLCNWQMDLTDFKKTHTDVTGGGAYGGLQTIVNGKTAILSFWEVLYKENGETKSHRASRIYPKGDESTFGGEGEGTNYIHEFNWPTNVWHRFVIYSWLDGTNNDTYVGEWIQNLETKEWTLFAYFNTKLKNSFITGGLSQFQENYNTKYYGTERSFHIKNMYAFDKNYQKWISLDTTTLAYDPVSWGLILQELMILVILIHIFMEAQEYPLKIKNYMMKAIQKELQELLISLVLLILKSLHSFLLLQILKLNL